MMKSQKLVLVLPFVFVLAVGAGAYWFVSQERTEQTTQTVPDTPDTPEPEPIPQPQPTIVPMLPIEPIPQPQEEIPQPVVTADSVTLNGRVVNERGFAVQGARVFVLARNLINADYRGRREQPREVNLGLMAISNSEGEYKAVFELPMRSETADLVVRTESTRHMAGEPAQLRAVNRGETRNGVDHVMQEAGSFVGVVRDKSGAPLEGIMIAATLTTAPTQATPPTSTSSVPGRRMEGYIPVPRPEIARSDANGEYRFPLLKAGVWRIESRVTQATEVEGPGEVEIIPGMVNRAATDIVIAMPTTLRLRVLDAAGNPLVGTEGQEFVAEFSLPSGEKVVLALALEDEGYVTIANVPHEAVSLQVRRHGYNPSGPYAISLVEGVTQDGPEIRLTRAEGYVPPTPEDDGVEKEG
jgi:hypothetical protein